MNLLDLPPELLGRILELSTAPDFENLMVTCRAIYACGTSRLASHNKNRRQWSRFVILDQHPWESWALVYRNLAYPYIAEYARFADFRASELALLNNNNRGSRVHRLSTGKLQQVEALLDRLPFLPEEVRQPGYLNDQLNDPHWDSWLPGRQWDWSLILLISQLKYLTRLTLPSDWLFAQRFTADGYGVDAAAAMDKHKSNLMTVLTTFMRDTHTAQPDAPLARCKIIRALGSHGLPILLATMSPLFAIKNVAEFHATSLFAKFRTTSHYPDLYCDAETAEISILPPYIWPYADLDSPLQRLELLESNVDVESIGALLAHTPCLRVFRYSHVPITTSDRPFHRDDEEAAIREYRKYSWDAAAFVDTVAKHCGHQLTELAITFGDRCKRFGITNAVTNMKDFTRLEHAELEVAMFGGSDELPTFEQHNASRDINVPRLVDILPSSLKRLELFDGFLCDPEAVVALMRDFAAGRTWLLSDLEEISYRHREYCEQIYPRPYYSAIERQADAQGISYASGPSIQAHWARSFGKVNGIFDTT